MALFLRKLDAPRRHATPINARAIPQIALAHGLVRERLALVKIEQDLCNPPKNRRRGEHATAINTGGSFARWSHVFSDLSGMVEALRSEIVDQPWTAQSPRAA
jgi:hypothetical protein